jgi:diadenosine tetraphosphate (Ap4A) HIT family hydrolase
VDAVKSLIYGTLNFSVLAHDRPHVDRADGGHIVILPKVRVKDRTYLSPSLAKELMKLTMIVGEAMATALNRRGIDIGRINYQDNGNWGVFRPEGPYLHIHLYGRAKSAKIQKYGEALHLPHRHTGFYDLFEPLNDGDIAEIHDEIERLSLTPKYQSF